MVCYWPKSLHNAAATGDLEEEEKTVWKVLIKLGLENKINLVPRGSCSFVTTQV